MLQLQKLGNKQNGGLSLFSVSKWELSWGLDDAKVVSYGGWVAVSGLPLNWWTPKFFSQVGEACGGLLQVDRKTEKLLHLFEAKIRVKENVVGFLPQFVRVSDGDVAVVVTISPISPAIKPPSLRGPVSTDAARNRWCKAREVDSEYRQSMRHADPLPCGPAGDCFTQRTEGKSAAGCAGINMEGVRLEGDRGDVHCHSRKSRSDLGGMGEDVELKGSVVTEVGGSLYRIEDFCCDIKIGDGLLGQLMGSCFVGPEKAQIESAKSGRPFLGLGQANDGPKSVKMDFGGMGGSILGAGPVSSISLPSSSPSSRSDIGPSLSRPRETELPHSSTSRFFAKFGNRKGPSTLRRLDSKGFGTYNAREEDVSRCSSDDDGDPNCTDGVDSEMGASTVFGDESDPFWDRFRNDALRGDGSVLDSDDVDSSQQGEGEALDLSLCEDGMLEKLFEESRQDPDVAFSHDCSGEKGMLIQEQDLRTYCRRKELSLVPAKNGFKAKNSGILSKMGISVVPLKKSLIFGKNGGFGSVSKVQGGNLDRKFGRFRVSLFRAVLFVEVLDGSRLGFWVCLWSGC